MPTIKVSGSLSLVKYQLRRIAALVRGRKNDGWTAFLDDEVWEYFTEQDERVCPVCEAFGSQFEFVGTEISYFFPLQQSMNLSDSLHRHRAPNVHETTNLYPDLRGKCRCNMFWREPFMTLVNRLAEEMVMVQ